MHVLYQPRPVGRRQTPEDGAAHHAPHTPHRKLVDLESGKAYTFHYQGAGADLSPPGDQQYKAPTSSASSSARGTAVGHHHRSSAARRQALWHLLLTLMACVGWVAASSLAILTNKHVMVDLHFKHPITVALMGLVATSAASAAVVKLRLVPTAAPKRTPSPAYLARNVLPTGFFMAVTFFMGNTAYLYLTVAFVQMLKALCPVITMLLLFLCRLERATTRLVLAVTAITAGVAIASYGELNMSLVGVAAMLTSVLTECVRLVLTQHVLTGMAFHPLEALMYIGPACAGWLLLMAVIYEAPAILRSRSYLIVASNGPEFFAAAFMGFLVNALAACVIKLASSLTLKVLGTVKDVLLVAVGVAFLHERVTGLQAAGYAVSLAGFVAYNYVKAGQQQQQQQQHVGGGSKSSSNGGGVGGGGSGGHYSSGGVEGSGIDMRSSGGLMDAPAGFEAEPLLPLTAMPTAAATGDGEDLHHSGKTQ